MDDRIFTFKCGNELQRYALAYKSIIQTRLEELERVLAEDEYYYYSEERHDAARKRDEADIEKLKKEISRCDAALTMFVDEYNEYRRSTGYYRMSERLGLR